MRAKDFGYIGLIVIVLFFVLIVWLMSSAVPSDQPTRILITRAFSCRSENNEWQKTQSFVVDESIFVCGQVSANAVTFRKQVQLRIYEGERDTLEAPIYYGNVWLTEKDSKIPVEVELAPGDYSIEISDGRTILVALQIVVTEN